MKRVLTWILVVLFSLVLQTTTSADDEVKSALLDFFTQLSNNNRVLDPSFGWNSTSDPCQWEGITCDNRTFSVKRIFLDSLELDGTFNPTTICNVSPLAASLTFISLNNNSLHGDLNDLANCRQLTHFHANQNQFFGTLADSLPRLNNLKRLDISNNNFAGILPDLAQISGLIEFLVQNNQLSGPIPNFDFANLQLFNVSNNNFSGPIPNGGASFNASSYAGNPQLCGYPLPTNCSASISNRDQADMKNRKSGLSRDEILLYAGYILIGLAVVILVMLKVCKKGKKKEMDEEAVDFKVAAMDESTSTKPSFISSEHKIDTDKSQVSAVSGESATEVSQSLIVLTSPEVNGLKFEELLKAPAELLGRGKHGSVYKVNSKEQGMTLAVKRIKDWTMSSGDFKVRMRKLDQLRHPSVLPAIAFYCSRQEKLLVYEYQANGSLFRLLHGGQTFDWSSRLGVASVVAEALAFMHEELEEDGIGHGNLKSSNILLNENMEPCLSEYGLMAVDNQDLSIVASGNNSFQANADHSSEATFKADVYALGVILLELLTGKMPTVQNNGMDLASWVVSVVREEWTVEVFDRSLIREGASEERMVNLLQIAIKCVNRSPEARPSMKQVAMSINAIREEDERSMDVSES